MLRCSNHFDQQLVLQTKVNAMTDKNNPFLDFDYRKFLESLTVPGVDTTDLIAAQQKNFQAMTNANLRAVGGAQALALCQAELMRDAVTQYAKATQEFAAAATPEEKAVKQAEIAEVALETTLSNARKLAEIVVKSNEDVTDAIMGRISESLEEVKNLATKKGKGKKSA
jgi:phasin family protein